MMMYSGMWGLVQNNLQNLLDLQTQLATERKYQKISDNPGAVTRALAIESSIRVNSQYIENQEDGSTMLRYAEEAMDSAIDILQQIRTKVIYAGDGALDSTSLEAIAQEIIALKGQLLDTLNTKIAGKYIFGGASCSTAPFVEDANGNITYVGSDQRLRYEIAEGVLSDVSFTGEDVMPSNYESYFICSHYVPLDWGWTGREEKVQISVGGRTLSVFIPEQWIDEVANGGTDATDYNRFRDPGELSSISLDDLATLVNRALVEQGADMLVTASVEKDYAAGQQRLVFKSNTGEPISVTGWPDTDYMPMPQEIAGLQKKMGSSLDWNQTMLIGSVKPDLTKQLSGELGVFLDGAIINGGSTAFDLSTFNGSTVEELADWMNDPATAGTLDGTGVTATVQAGHIVLVGPDGSTLQVSGSGTQSVFGSATKSASPDVQGISGTVNLLSWGGDGLGKSVDVTVNGVTKTFNLDDYRTITELTEALNAAFPNANTGGSNFAELVAGRLALHSDTGTVSVSDASGNAGGTEQLFGTASSISSSSSSLTLTLGDGFPVTIYINEDDTLADVASKIDSIEGIYCRTSADGTQLVVVAERTGAEPADPLAVATAEESLHYPSFTISGTGMAMSLFDFSEYSVNTSSGEETGAVKSTERVRPTDHSHIDVFDYLCMETALKSREYEPDEKITVAAGEQLRWRVMSGSHVTEITIGPGEYTLSQIADRLKNAGAGWLEVTVDVSGNVPPTDDTETGMGTSANYEKGTSRIVIRSADGQSVSLMDMNEYRYAEELGLSTATRSDEKTGVEPIVLPTAPCLDSNLAAMVRVQMTCGKTYDIRLRKKDIVDESGNVDRVKVMEQIAKQVNSEAGYEVMQVVIPVDANGKQLTGSASLVAITGEPFEVVDLPVPDPSWNESYTSGIAAQMGIHGGVTSLLEITDDEPIEEGGVIRFETLGHSVEIEVFAGDTAKAIMDRLRAAAGDWLYVNYFDANMGNVGYLAGDNPILSIAAKDGSPVNVVDVVGTVAQDDLLLSTAIEGDVDLTNWPTLPSTGATFSITVAGYTHTIDLNAMLDVNGNGIDAEDLVETINARMQDYDVRAELSDEGHLNIWSPRGYTVTVNSNVGITVDDTTTPVSFTAGTYQGPVVSSVSTVTDAGSGVPTAAAPNGDTYLDTATGDVYTYDAATPKWNLTGALAAGEAVGVTSSGTDDVYYLVGTTVTQLTAPDNAVLQGSSDIMVFDNGAWSTYGAYAFLGTASSSTPYRGGYDLANVDRTAPGIFNQNVVTRSGSNRTEQNFFGVLDDITAAVRAENRDDLVDKLLPLIDSFMDALLKSVSTSGALQQRYDNNVTRLKLNDISMTEEHERIMGVDLEKIVTDLMLAQTIYQASLGTISYVVQPTLLSFLS
jgi:flagellin-like hook-associated protein FlgL